MSHALQFAQLIHREGGNICFGELAHGLALCKTEPDWLPIGMPLLRNCTTGLYYEGVLAEEVMGIPERRMA